MMSKSFLLLFACLLSFSACNRADNPLLDTMTSGDIKISVDETFEPIIEQEVIVFEHKNPEATVEPLYTNEKEAIDFLIKDSVRLSIVTRKLSEIERKKLVDDYALHAREIKLATDGIAIITNKENKDTLITVGQLRRIMTGAATKWTDIFPNSSFDGLQLVFDNTNSSTVRYAVERICNGTPLTGKVYAQNSNAEVIEYVANNKNAIGVIGVSWIGNKTDTTRLSFLDNVTTMAVSAELTATTTNSYKPFQAYLALEQYPLTREIYVILTDPRNGLPTGFLTFLTSNIGQKIILKEGIVPATQVVRVVNVKDE